MLTMTHTCGTNERVVYWERLLVSTFIESTVCHPTKFSAAVVMTVPLDCITFYIYSSIYGRSK